MTSSYQEIYWAGIMRLKGIALDYATSVLEIPVFVPNKWVKNNDTTNYTWWKYSEHITDHGYTDPMSTYICGR